MTRVVLASSNPGKLRELAALLAPLSLTLIPQGALGITAVPESGATFLANALLKARHAARCAQLPGCVIVLVRSAADEGPLIAHGSWEGHIGSAPRGRGGFGYDPVFVPLGERRSAAELDTSEKNSLSHRARALRALVAMLESASYIAAP